MQPFDFGENLRKYRQKRKLTQKRLGELAGCTESNIGSLEANTSRPSMTRLIKLCGALNVSADALLGLKPSKEIEHETIIVDDLTQEQRKILDLIIKSWQK